MRTCRRSAWSTTTARTASARIRGQGRNYLSGGNHAHRHHHRRRSGPRRALRLWRTVHWPNGGARREDLHRAVVHRRGAEHVARRGEGRLLVHGGAADLPRDLRRARGGRGLRLVEVFMTKGRLEAFSDGVIAVIITIMVLELKVPHGADAAVLAPLVPVFLTYVLSFVFIAIYWN